MNKQRIRKLSESLGVNKPKKKFHLIIVEDKIGIKLSTLYDNNVKKRIKIDGDKYYKTYEDLLQDIKIKREEIDFCLEIIHKC